MLTKGHHWPDVTLVVVVGADSGLYSIDFRAGERLMQQLIQVAGRAGRAAKPGRVLLQTHHPDHPLVLALLRGGYPACVEEISSERAAAQFPPFTYAALLRAESKKADAAQRFLGTAAGAFSARKDKHLLIAGPLPSPIPKRADLMRFQCLLMHPQRQRLQQHLSAVTSSLYTLAGNDVRWTLDVDPQDFS
jgi:primosomal protein N' (replication factor Y) (superfamily II helicase)